MSSGRIGKPQVPSVINLSIPWPLSSTCTYSTHTYRPFLQTLRRVILYELVSQMGIRNLKVSRNWSYLLGWFLWSHVDFLNQSSASTSHLCLSRADPKLLEPRHCVVTEFKITLLAFRDFFFPVIVRYWISKGVALRDDLHSS